MWVHLCFGRLWYIVLCCHRKGRTAHPTRSHYTNRSSKYHCDRLRRHDCTQILYHNGGRSTISNKYRQRVQIHIYICVCVCVFLISVLNIQQSLLAQKINCSRVRSKIPSGLVVRIRRSHRRGRGSIPRLGKYFFLFFFMWSNCFS